MGSFLSKIIGVVLAVILLIFVPAVGKASLNCLRSERISWDYLELFTDTIADKGSITQADYIEFMNNMATSGVTYDVQIRIDKLLAMPPTAPTDAYFTTSYDTQYIWNSSTGESIEYTKAEAGDILVVTCKPVSKTFSQSFINAISHIDIQSSNIISSKMIRNNGGG